MNNLLYFALLLFSIAFPLFRSFESKIYFIGKLKNIMLGILTVLLIFIPWDIWFTSAEVWGFNAKYILNVKLFHLPLEEILFFVIIPFSCLFIYEVIDYFGVIKRFYLGQLKTVYYALAAILFIVAGINFNLTYTFWVCIITGLIVLISTFIIPRLLSNFILLYLVSLVPFVLVNSVLTGYVTDEPVVWYNGSEMLNVRVGTIPIEDFVYNFGMLLTAFIPYQRIKKNKS